MTAPDRTPPPETPKQAAARWFARRRSGAMSVHELREFEVWRARDPVHAAAYDALAWMWDGAQAARADPEVMAMREAAFRAHPRRKRPMPVALAACLAAGCLVTAGIGGWLAVNAGLLSSLFPAAQAQEFRTGVGQTVTMTLPDGSVVTLDTDTVLRTRSTGSRRLAQLEQGRAFFHVAKDPARPFVVEAGGKTVTATGTEFDVRVDPRRFEVTLVEGQVRVEGPVQTALGAFSNYIQATNMQAGTRLIAEGDRRWRLVNVDVDREMGWLSGQLRFRDAPLGEVAAELNRYSRRKVVIRDGRIAARPIQGSFTAGDVEEFVKAVQAYRLARVGSESRTEIVLVAP